MSHEVAYVICENKCLVKGYSADQTDELIEKVKGFINAKDGEPWKMWVGTKAEYEALTQISPTTYYIITDDPEVQHALMADQDGDGETITLTYRRIDHAVMKINYNPTLQNKALYLNPNEDNTNLDLTGIDLSNHMGERSAGDTLGVSGRLKIVHHYTNQPTYEGYIDFNTLWGQRETQQTISTILSKVRLSDITNTSNTVDDAYFIELELSILGQTLQLVKKPITFNDGSDYGYNEKSEVSEIWVENLYLYWK